jgi:hypothetical protein
MALEETPERRDPGALAAFFQLLPEFGERDVGPLRHRAENEARLDLDVVRPAIAALLLWYEQAARADLRSPADRTSTRSPQNAPLLGGMTFL